MRKFGTKTNKIAILDLDCNVLVEAGNFQQAVFSRAEVDATLEEVDVLSDCIFVILAELNWPQESAHIFAGFDLANLIRRKYRLTCPIIITSTFKVDVFEQLARKNPAKFNILFAPGTHFLHVEELYKRLTNGIFEDYVTSLPPITPSVIEDMLEMLLQQKGLLIDKVTHDLKFSLSQEELKVALENIGSYLTSQQQNEMDYSRLSKSILLAHESTFNDAKEKLLEACNRHLNRHDDNISNQGKLEKTGKVLIIEDDPEQRDLLKEKLQDHFQVEVTGESGKALEILKTDATNEILAIIADWRLLKYDKAGNKTDYWQDLQGYQVLEMASKSHFAALISLTAEHDKNVHQIRNRLGTAIDLFKKQHIYASGDYAQWEMFIDIVRQKCRETATLISSIPTAANWRKYSGTYREVRLSTQWTAFEHEVAEQARQYWEYFKDSLNPQTRVHINQGLQDIIPLNTLKNVLIGRRMFFTLYYEFLRLRNDATLDFPPEQVIRVESEEKGSSILDTYAVLRNNWWDPNVYNDKVAFERYNQQAKNLLKDLCIKSEETGRMLPEEKDWLTKQGIDYSLQKVKFKPEEDEF